MIFLSATPRCDAASRSTDKIARYKCLHYQCTISLRHPCIISQPCGVFTSYTAISLLQPYSVYIMHKSTSPHVVIPLVLSNSLCVVDLILVVFSTPYKLAVLSCNGVPSFYLELHARQSWHFTRYRLDRMRNFVCLRCVQISLS